MSRTIREWILHEEIGRGGMGVVYRATHVLSEGDYAIKAIKPSLINNEESRKRFLAEAWIMGGLQHERIIKTHPPFKEMGEVFLPMERLSGATLSETLRQRPAPWPEQEAVALIQQVIEAMACAHNHAPPILHRDLKPGNIFMCRDGKVKVMDFGLAKALDGTQQRVSDTAVGTPRYMAPELLEGQPASVASDLYAVGLVLYELLTGVLPFEGLDPQQRSPEVIRRAVLDAHHTGLPDVRQYAPGVSASLAKLVMVCIARFPQRRPGDAESFGKLLTSSQIGAGIRPEADNSLLSFQLGDDDGGARTSAQSGQPPEFSALNEPIAVQGEAAYTPPVHSSEGMDPLQPDPESLRFFDQMLSVGTQFEHSAEQIGHAWQNVQVFCRNQAIPDVRKIKLLQHFIRVFRGANNPYQAEALEWLEKFGTDDRLKVETVQVIREIARPAMERVAVKSKGLFGKTRYENVMKVQRVQQLFNLRQHSLVTHTGEEVLLVGSFLRVDAHSPGGQMSPQLNSAPARPDRVFELLDMPVDHRLWRAVMERGSPAGEDFVSVGACEAVAFCNRLSERAGLTPYYLLNNVRGEPGQANFAAEVGINPQGSEGYRLPGHAEWSFCAGEATPTGGTQPQGYHYNSNGFLALRPDVWEWNWEWFVQSQATAGSPRTRGGGYSRSSLMAGITQQTGYGASHGPVNRFDTYRFRIARYLN